MREKMIARAQRVGIALTERQAEQFEIYHRMLVTANASFNLTRVPDEVDEAIDRNYLDCILPVHSLREMGVQRAIDVGSGAGFPGLPLAICMPETHFVLMDALGKRVSFLNEVIRTLGLNAEAVHLRAEDGARKKELREQFDLATARAVAPLNLLCEYLLPFVRVGGCMLAMKGPGLDEELVEAQHALQMLGGTLAHTQTVQIPGRDWTHTLAWIDKSSFTPEQYPRRAGKPEKSPL